MSVESGDIIILCQPDNSKGCSVCCGLFNFRDISRESLVPFLEKGRDREKEYRAHEEFSTPFRLRSRFSHICPFQGFLSEGKPGCLVHPLFSGSDGRDRSLFAHKICETFFCPAHSILSTEEKLFLINNIKDWHLYCCAIADPESFSFIYKFVNENYSEFRDMETFNSLVITGLSVHEGNLSMYEGEIFFYSIPEYNLNRKNFCITYMNEFRELVVAAIRSHAAASGAC